MGWPLLQKKEQVRQLKVVLQAGYTLGQERVFLALGYLWLGQWTFGALLFLLVHYPPQSALGRFLLFDVYITPPLWCQSGTLLLDSLPLGEHAADW